MKKIKFIVALWIGKIVVILTKIIDKERGTNVPGAFAFKVSKDFISNFTNIDYEKVVFITGTNGKSTTNNMIVHCMRSAGKTVCTNIEGANLITGIATAMIKYSNIWGKMKTEYLVFETDERFLKYIHELLPAKNICITNIQKDQVQRNGEPDYIYQKIKNIIKDDINIYVNNQEPRSKSFEDFSKNVVYYGVEKNVKSFKKDDKYSVTMPCPKCNGKIKFDYYNVDNIGNFECTSCGHRSNNDIEFLAKNIDYSNNTFECLGNTYKIDYVQPYFIYNYILCIAICKKIGISDDKIEQALRTFKNLSGRFEVVKYGDKRIKYVRMKQENPETLQSALDFVCDDKEKKILVMGLSEVKDINPYYANTFYTFDCDFKKLKKANIEKYICFSEAVAYDSANRLIYDGIPKEKIEIIPTENEKEVLDKIKEYKCNNIYLITLLKKFEEIKEEVKNRRGELT